MTVGELDTAAASKTDIGYCYNLHHAARRRSATGTSKKISGRQLRTAISGNQQVGYTTDANGASSWMKFSPEK